MNEILIPPEAIGGYWLFVCLIWAIILLFGVSVFALIFDGLTNDESNDYQKSEH